MGQVSLMFRVKEPDTKNPDGGYIPVSELFGLPVHTVSAMRLSREGSLAGKYVRIEPDQTAVLGALGDYLGSLLVIPLAATVGSIDIGDGATSFPIYQGGPLSGDRRPFKIDIGAYSKDGPWSVTTGSNIAVLATGDFT